jgi:hypothetical protein
MSVVAVLFACIMTLHGVETMCGTPPEDPNFLNMGKRTSMTSDVSKCMLHRGQNSTSAQDKLYWGAGEITLAAAICR